MSKLKVDTLANSADSASTPIADVINGSARAFVNFNGTGTVAIRAAYNVSSITDNGTGLYTVNFANAMPDANYSAVATAINDSEALLGTQASGSCGVITRQQNTGTTQDSSIICVAIFR
jgi:hypothetical protein